MAMRDVRDVTIDNGVMEWVSGGYRYQYFVTLMAGRVLFRAKHDKAWRKIHPYTDEAKAQIASAKYALGAYRK